ncbi:MAG: 3-phosphoshikimate 1-carboxyvinyltransferase [Planctomycetales bacterium]|nr:3-phosphoshikimate 1-carboxyvinyltransferase [Planctomycetales bacterium]
MSNTIEITPVTKPVSGTIRPPGSKSLTNRALIVAALADGRSRLTGVLDSQDTRVMIDSLQRLGLDVRHDVESSVVVMQGQGGLIPSRSAELWLENSGTSIRFLTAFCALGSGRYRLDGNARMRERPIGELVSALRQLGADVTCELGTNCPPVVIQAAGLTGGVARVKGNISSQYLSGLLMAAPAAKGSVEIVLEGNLVSEPYIDMTLGVMAQFNVQVESDLGGRYVCHPQPYRAANYDIEPDASAASYFFAAAAITGGKVAVAGLTRHSLQGDMQFVDALEKMGCRVLFQSGSVTVTGGPLKGIDIDMGAISDTAQTLAAVAPFADGPTRIRNVAHIRHKETDRITALVTELRRLGITVDEHDDGLTIHPGAPQPATIQTYDDHRMAMSFSLIGLRSPGIRIANPECTSKTYPEFFRDLQKLCDAGDRPS